MNDTLVLRCIRHIESLDEDAVVYMGDRLLDVPGVIIPVNSKNDPRHKHAILLNDVAANVDILDAAHKYGQRPGETMSEAVELLWATLYLYAIHYPGLVSGIVNAD